MATGNSFVVLTANLLLYLLCNSFSLATIINPPTFVYRADFRGPMEIFRNGMRNLGNNENLIDHVTGDSCTMGTMKNTAFVATSLDEDTAVQFGLNLLWETSGRARNIYVYKIRATEFFYDVQESLKKAYKATGNNDYLDMAEAFEVEQEWVAYGGISRELFMSAKVYIKGSRQGDGQLVRTDKNEYYLPERSRGNSDAFPVNRLTKRLTLVASNSPNVYSACFLSDCPSTSLGRSGAVCVRPNVVTMNLDDIGKGETGWYWDTEKRILTEGQIPWKEVTSTVGGHTIQKPEYCAIDVGHPSDVSPRLTIKCPKNPHYERFRVYLRGGHGKRQPLFHTKHKEGVAGRMWQKSARQIRMMRGGNLESEGYTTNDVFGDKYGIWWTEIHIYPLYPIIKL